MLLYGRPETASTIVHCALELCGADYRIEPVVRNPDGSVSPAGYRQLNPNGTVPTLVDGELTIYETVAILEHLVDTQPGLGPRAGEPNRAQLHFWLGWLTNNLMAALYHWFHAGEMIAPATVDALRTGAVANLAAHGRWLEAELADRRWLIGEAPTVADVYLACLYDWTTSIEPLTFGGPALSGHAGRTYELPAVAKALAQESAAAAA